jgi:predicted nucleic acid-binding protein
MSVRSFLDSNILVYTDDHDSPRKQARALELIERERIQGAGAVSTQVLEEYFTAATRKLRVPPSVARRKVEIFARFHLVLIHLDDILAAIDLHRLHGLTFWDALVVRTAQAANCSILYSEDLQHGRSLDGLQIVNPFQ